MDDLTRYRINESKGVSVRILSPNEKGYTASEAVDAFVKMKQIERDDSLRQIAEAWKAHRAIQDEATRTGTTTGTPWTTFRKVAGLLDALLEGNEDE